MILLVMRAKLILLLKLPSVNKWSKHVTVPYSKYSNIDASLKFNLTFMIMLWFGFLF